MEPLGLEPLGLEALGLEALGLEAIDVEAIYMEAIAVEAVDALDDLEVNLAGLVAGLGSLLLETLETFALGLEL